MQRSESIKALAKALVLASPNMVAPHKNKTNPHFKNKYADLAAVKSSYQVALQEAGLSVVSALALKDSVLTLTTTVVHAESAEFIASDFPIPAGLKAQEIGSAVSYGRRYNVCSLLDIVAEDDDDGEAASAGKAPEKKPEPAKVDPPKPSVLTNEEITAVHTLAKKAGYKNTAELAPFLSKLCKVTKASELSRNELTAVMDALNAMTPRAVPA